MKNLKKIFRNFAGVDPIHWGGIEVFQNEDGKLYKKEYGPKYPKGTEFVLITEEEYKKIERERTNYLGR